MIKIERGLLVLLLIISIGCICLLVFYNICRKGNSTVSSGFAKYHIIAHNMEGGVDSKRGFENARVRGTRLLDADLRFSEDGELVLCHEWEGVSRYFSFSKEDIYYNDMNVGQIERSLLPNKEEFCKTKIDNQYTMISLADVVEQMKEWRDIYIVCDAKEGAEETYLSVCRTVDHNPDVLDRIVVSLYRADDFDTVKDIYPFKRLAIRQYENLPRSADEIMNTCKEKQINIVNVGTAYRDTNTTKACKESGLQAYTAVVSDISYFDKLRNIGVGGIVSDSIYEDMIDAK